MRTSIAIFVDSFHRFFVSDFCKERYFQLWHVLPWHEKKQNYYWVMNTTGSGRNQYQLINSCYNKTL